MNLLANETSPYLQQHAHNPVHWQIWSEKALQQAREHDKPLIVSIGYATCHWCHVMERESFEDQTTADYMNEHFICIKIDREERPDIDSIYMDALQAMGVSGGWPLNVFLLPDGRPFYGGTYFPPRPAHGRPSWTEVLHRIKEVYTNQRKIVLENALRLTDRLATMDTAFFKRFQPTEKQSDSDFSATIHAAFQHLKEQFDTEEGGFGTPPKFLGTMAIQFLLEYNYFYKNTTAYQHAKLSLLKMSRGGLYDHLAGGFSRYSTDRFWLVPHFEKMLYDNALIINNLADCIASITDPESPERNEMLKTLNQTLDYIKQQMTSVEGAFYTAEDADSEGVEGKFYVWQKEEIVSIIESLFYKNKESESINLETEIEKYTPEKIIEWFCEFYNITDEGNWEATNILHNTQSLYDFCKNKNCSHAYFLNIFEKLKIHLHTIRAKRIRPLRDEKIILGWNALMAKAFLKASYLENNSLYKEIAVKNINFLLQNFKKTEQANNREIPFYHVGAFTPQFDLGHSEEAFLDDYAYLIDALIENNQLFEADTLINYLFEHFFDQKNGLFYYTNNNTDLIIRKKDYYDGAMPSGNATMALNLLKIAILLDKPDYQTIAVRMLDQLKPVAEKFPLSFARWLEAIQRLATPFVEVAIVGEKSAAFAAELRKNYTPHLLLQYANEADSKYPLLQQRQPPSEELTYIYVCQNYTCKQPVSSIEDCLLLF